ncbi:MAG: Na+/H+ antiporter subunit D [Micrococcales bacterium]|nr:MAG: Na+/H+ antiporter subunit D [Micrococcales bacterium]PIE27744.1 MAG: Na+/H+ antiporter subunit D [Micrococcales bacterium]
MPEGVAVGTPIAVPITAAAISLLLGVQARRWLSFLTLSTVTVVATLLAIRVDADGPIAVQAGGWDAPFGITLVADRLSAALIVTSLVMLLLVLLYATGQGVTGDPYADRATYAFHPSYMALSAGVCFAFLTGDLFNLFVAFEVMLTASYVLFSMRADSKAVRSSMTYIVVSLLASGLFVSTVGLVYAATGTVNFAQLGSVMAQVDEPVRVALAIMLMLVFGIKAALFPLYFWLPDSYPTTPAPVTAVFAGLLTKVGVYAILRSQLFIFDSERHITGPILLALAGATLLFGILGAIAQNEIKRLLTFIIVSHIGFMIMGLGLHAVAAVAGAVFYIVHHIVMQTSIFCVEGLIERRTGTSQMDKIRGLAHRSPLLAVLFALPAMSLAGFPPFSGFVGKIALFRAGVQESSWGIVAMAALVSLLTVFALSKVWVRSFWGKESAVVGDPDPTDELDLGVRTVPRAMTAATVAAVAAGLAIPLFGGPLYAYSERAAQGLVSGQEYVTEVLGAQP